MATYLKFYQLQKSPFEAASQSTLVLGTQALRDAFAGIKQGLEEDAARICISGAGGLGKTSLARALPKLLGDEVRTALVLDPTLPWPNLKTGIARQLGLVGGLSRASLVAAQAGGRRLVLVIDQAEQLDAERLEHLDIVLAYRSDEGTPLVQCVLLANLDVREEDEEALPLIWWLDQLHTLQLEFAPIPRDGVGAYLSKHLKRAGWRGGRLFSKEASDAIHGYTGGVPGRVGPLAHRLLALAAERRLPTIDVDLVDELCADPDDAACAPDPAEVPELILEDILESIEELADGAALVEKTEDGPEEALSASPPEDVSGREPADPAPDVSAQPPDPAEIGGFTLAPADDEDAAAADPEPFSSELRWDDPTFDPELDAPITAEELAAIAPSPWPRRLVFGLVVIGIVAGGIALARSRVPGVDRTAPYAGLDGPPRLADPPPATSERIGDEPPRPPLGALKGPVLPEDLPAPRTDAWDALGTAAPLPGLSIGRPVEERAESLTADETPAEAPAPPAAPASAEDQRGGV